MVVRAIRDLFESVEVEYLLWGLTFYFPFPICPSGQFGTFRCGINEGREVDSKNDFMANYRGEKARKTEG